MVIWIILLAMTAAAVMAVLWPLSRHRAVVGQADPDTQFYREQIAEIERDRARGVLLPSEAEAAKAEAGRRLLRATGLAAATPFAAVGEPALRRRRAASTLALSIVPILALAVYGVYGSPQLPSQPPGARLQPRSGQQSISWRPSPQIEAHLAKNPQDGRGWEVIAPVYLRMGRMDDAVKAYEAALCAISAPDADRFANYGEALVHRQGWAGVGGGAGSLRAGGRARSRHRPRRASISPARPSRTGRSTRRRRCLHGSSSPPSPADAPWVPLVREQLAALGAPARRPRVAAAADRPEAIAGMVAGLASRLEAQGGTRRGMGAADALLCGARAARQGAWPRPSAPGRPWRRMPPGLKTIDTMAQRTANSTDAQGHDAASSAASP